MALSIWGYHSDETHVAYGAGAQVRWRKLAFRAEYEKFTADEFELDLISLGATYTFGVPGATGTAHHADVPKGPYVGAAIARARFDEQDLGVRGSPYPNFDVTNWKYEKSGNVKVLGGWRLHENFAIESAYLHAGKPYAMVPVGFGRTRLFSAEAQGFSAFAVGLVPLGSFDLFAKAGSLPSI